MQQKRKRQFSGLRQSYIQKEKPTEIPNRSSLRRYNPELNSTRNNMINRDNQSNNDKKINEIQQLSNNYILSSTQTKPNQVNTKEQKHLNTAQQPKQVCVNCINKMIATKHQREQSQKKQRQKREQKAKLQKEKQQLYNQRLEKLNKIQESLNINKGLIQQKVKKTIDEKSNKNHLLQQIKLQKKERDLEQQRFIQQQRLKKQKFRRQLQNQIQNKKQNKMKNLKQQKERYITTFFNEDQIEKRNKQKLQVYKNSLLHQINEKQTSIKEKKIKQQEYQKRYIQNLINIPDLQYTLPPNSSNIKKQLQRKQLNKKNQQMQRRKHEQMRRKEQAQIQVQQRRILTDQKINQMKKYVEDLGIQLEQTKRRKRQQRQYKLKPAFSIVGDPSNDFKNCNKCDLKFPSNYLSKIYDF